MAEFKDIEAKWQQKWSQAKIFEANPDDREKFFVNFPYPYINAYQHIGHLFTLMRVEAFARFKRLKGFNVLFPQGWHATGSPIVNAAKRVKSREEKQIKIMKDMGIPETEFPKFEDPKYWIEFFAPEFKKDYESLGMSVDWRRNFHTTSLNPHYDKFIRWQFRKLKEKGFVIKGKFPVVWDPVEKCPVGDHGRIEGEGETTQEFCLFKFELPDNRHIITATLRPDTVMGITNVYVNPKETYQEIEVTINNNKESWIVGKPIIEKLKQQDFLITEKEEVKGIDLIGKKVKAFSGLEIPVLPASFLDSNYGTGMVHSVPSDSADDLIALLDLQKNKELIKEYNLDENLIKNIEPIPIFDTPEIGDCPAQFFLEKYKITSQKQRKELEKIKKELYKLTFNQSTFNEKYQTGFEENLQGTLVKNGQEIIKRELIQKGAINIFYELTGKVVSRSLTECVVKIVDDQWFMDYNNPDWKKLAHECLDSMTLYPEKCREQFNYVIDWLHEWACTREEGLGTKLPWDEKWLIESLSDSTIYMAYYTIAHIIKEMPIEEVNDELFDYILLNKGESPSEIAEDMKKCFDYYYPVDFRNSGKDLVQNHLTFYIFNHVALFPKDKWPKGIGANGWVTVDGQKMSKSLGNMIPVREVVEKYSADVARITILNGGEEMDDPNWDSKFAESMIIKLQKLSEFCIENYKKSKRSELKQIDSWLISEVNRILKELDTIMEKTLFRTAIQKVYFEMQNTFKNYTKRTNGDYHKDTLDFFIETQLIILSPFTPHICEETWEKLGQTGFITESNWPTYDESKIDYKLSMTENYLSNILSDIRTVKQLAKLEDLKEIKIFISPAWKYEFFDIIKKELDNDNRDFKAILGKLMQNETIRTQGKIVTKMLPMLLKKGLPEYSNLEEEINTLKETINSIQEEFSAEVSFEKADDSSEQKASQATPGKPAILVF